jgi:hypothetical protein
MSRPFTFAVIAASSLLGAVPASALTMSPNPLSLVNASLAGEIELVDVVTGLPAGATVQGGSVGASDTTFVFQAHVFDQPVIGLNGWNIIALALAPVGSSGSGSNVPPTAAGIVGTPTNLSLFSLAGIQFRGGVPELTSSDLFFVSYASPVAADGSLELRFVAGEGVTFVAGSALVVPEAGPALLLALAGALGAVLRAYAPRTRSRSCLRSSPLARDWIAPP